MCCLLYPFARLGDRYGRKPIIVAGTIITCLAGSSFGFGRSYAALLLIRAITGTFNAAQGALARSMMMEVSVSSNRSLVFAFGGMGWQMGATLAPAIGATFAEPARKWPVFASSLFENYPYALPCVVACGIPLLVALSSIFLMKETQDRKRATQARRATALPPLLNKQTNYILWVTALMYGQGAAIFSLEVLLFFTPVQNGGLGLAPSQIACYLFGRPLVIIFLETIFFPPLERRFGIAMVFRAAICVRMALSAGIR
jgi:MFS family permease